MDHSDFAALQASLWKENCRYEHDGEAEEHKQLQLCRLARLFMEGKLQK